jgi:hypothetical protein
MRDPIATAKRTPMQPARASSKAATRNSVTSHPERRTVTTAPMASSIKRNTLKIRKRPRDGVMHFSALPHLHKQPELLRESLHSNSAPKGNAALLPLNRRPGAQCGHIANEDEGRIRRP